MQIPTILYKLIPCPANLVFPRKKKKTKTKNLSGSLKNLPWLTLNMEWSKADPGLGIHGVIPNKDLGIHGVIPNTS